MGCLGSRPFTGAAPPFLADQVCHDVSEKGCCSVAPGPTALGWIIRIPHAQRSVGVPVWGVGGPVHVHVRNLRSRGSEHDVGGPLTGGGHVQSDRQREAAAVTVRRLNGRRKGAAGGELALEEDAYPIVFLSTVRASRSCSLQRQRCSGSCREPSVMILFSLIHLHAPAMPVR